MSPQDPSTGQDESLDVAGYYDKHYYANYAGGQTYTRDAAIWQRFFQYFADRIVADLKPRSVLDVGCSVGILVEALRDRGVEACGIDVSEYAIGQVRPDIQAFCHVASITKPLERRFDLVVCVEVIEHVPRQLAHVAIENIATHSDAIVFSSTPEDFADPSHLNVRPSEYWVGLFAKFGHFRDLDQDVSYVTPHAMCLRRRPEPQLVDVVVQYERHLSRASAEAASVRRVNMELVQENQRLKDRIDDVRSPTRSTLRSQFDGLLRRAQPFLAPQNTYRYTFARAVLRLARRGTTRQPS